MVPAQCTHSAVASTGGVDVLPRAPLTDQLGLVQEVQSPRPGQSRKEVALRPHRGDRLALGQGSPVADGPVLHPSVASDAPGPSGRPPDVSAARRPSPGRLGPGRCTDSWRSASR